jgi:hypothetical protein
MILTINLTLRKLTINDKSANKGIKSKSLGGEQTVSFDHS